MQSLLQVDKQTAAETLAQKGVAVGIPSVQVDGMDPLAVYAVTKAARDWAVAGNGPVLIETITELIGPHYSTSGDDLTRYRSEESFDYWEQRDPLTRYRNYLTEKELWTDEQEEELIKKVTEEVAEAAKEADQVEKMTVSDSLSWMFSNPGQKHY